MNKNFKGEDLIKNSEGVNSVKKWFHSKKVPLKQMPQASIGIKASRFYITFQICLLTGM